MTILRKVAQQALEALGKWSSGRDMNAVALNDLIFTLEAALAQQSEANTQTAQKRLLYLHRENARLRRRIMADAVQKDALARQEQAEPDWDEVRCGGPGCDLKCCQPVAEPVAWQVHPFDYGIGHDGVYARTDRSEQVAAWERKGWKVQPLYTAPPQRKPLTEEELWPMWEAEAKMNREGGNLVKAFARAIERAHGIGGSDE